MVESKVGRSTEVEPLFHSGQGEERILFCRPPLIWEEAVAFPYLFFDRPRDLAPLVFEVCLVDANSLLERAAFFPLPFPGVPLSALPAFWGLPLEGLQRMLFRTCADWDADFCGGLDLVVVLVGGFVFLGGASTALCTVFWWWLSRQSISSTFLYIFYLLFKMFGLLGHLGCDLLGNESADELGWHWHFLVYLHGCFLRGLGDVLAFSSFDILSSNSLNWYWSMNSPQPETEDDPRSHLCFGLGGVHTPVSCVRRW